MSNLILAIDPGLTGAFALLDQYGSLMEVEDLPVIRDGKSAWIDSDSMYSTVLRWRGGSDMVAVTERIHAMPKNGSKAAFSQGCTFGSILATLQMLRSRIEFVAPQSWKRELGLICPKEYTDRQRKEISMNRARLLFPNAPLARQNDHGRADALLIGYWYHKTHSLIKHAEAA